MSEGSDYRATIKWGDAHDEQHTYLFQGGVLQHPDKCSAATEAIGFAITHWARLETHIDAAILHLSREEFYGKVDWVVRPHPRLFPDKLDKLKKLFKWHPAISAMYPDVVKIASALSRIVETRNILAHSVFEHIEAATKHESAAMIFNALKVKRDGSVELFLRKITFESLGAFSRVVDEINGDFSEITKNVFSETTFEKLRTLCPHKPSDCP